jgi:hypothetical protein
MPKPVAQWLIDNAAAFEYDPENGMNAPMSETPARRP